ncbi:MAG: hypothetical protein ABSB71_04980 [Candidatus Bathyarchaeia archaeon]
MVKYSGLQVEIATIEGPVKLPVKIRGIALKQELVQTAGTILKILDWLQFSTCKRIETLQKMNDIPQEKILDLILQQDEDAHMIANLAILLIASPKSAETFEKVLSDWIAAAFPRAKRMHVVPPESKPSRELLEMERENDSIEKELLDLKSRERELQEHKRHLEKNIALRKETVFFEYGYNTISPAYFNRELSIETDLTNQLSKAMTAFPYLSEALKKEKPFEIRESLKYLQTET